jgi:hypothetical protein
MSDKHTAKKEIEDTILDAFNRWSIRDDEDYLSRWERAKGEELKILGEEVRQDSLFLTKRVFAPGFARHVSKVLRNNSVINAQRRILLKACLLSIMNESGAKTEDVIKRKGSSSAAFIQDSTDEITRRHYQRYVHEEFNEIFFPLADDGLLKKRKDDERFKPVSSVFAPGNLPPDDKEQVSLKHLEEEREATAENPDLTKRITLDSFLHLVTPEYLEGLLEFQKESLQLLGEIGVNTVRGEVLAEELSNFTLILGVFYAHFESMLAVYWYRRRRATEKKKLMALGFPLRYSKSDAVKTSQLLKQLTNSTEKTFQIMYDGAKCFEEYSLPDCADYLFDECLKLDFPISKRSEIAESVAFLHRNKSNHRNMLHYAKLARKLAGNSRMKYLECICLRDIAEAEWHLGLFSKATSHFQEVERNVGTLSNDQERFGAYFNLAFGARRLGQRDAELRYLKKCLKHSDVENTEAVLEVDRRIGELSRY